MTKTTYFCSGTKDKGIKRSICLNKWPIQQLQSSSFLGKGKRAVGNIHRVFAGQLSFFQHKSDDELWFSRKDISSCKCYSFHGPTASQMRKKQYQAASCPATMCMDSGFIDQYGFPWVNVRPLSSLGNNRVLNAAWSLPVMEGREGEGHSKQLKISKIRSHNMTKGAFGMGWFIPKPKMI